MYSIQNPDGSYVTTPIFVGTDHQRFTRHERTKHDWKRHSQPQENDEYTIHLEHCDCGAVRATYIRKDEDANTGT